jgi:hypothetical protein
LSLPRRGGAGTKNIHQTGAQDNGPRVFHHFAGLFHLLKVIHIAVYGNAIVVGYGRVFSVHGQKSGKHPGNN